MTTPARRRQGFGRALVEGMLRWARAHGARYAYLQVLEQNTPARQMYDVLGFQALYRYWYRAAPVAGSGSG